MPAVGPVPQGPGMKDGAARNPVQPGFIVLTKLGIAYDS